VPSWLSFATHLAERRGLFAKNQLSQVQDFLLKVDMALSQPIADSKRDLAMLRRDIGIAHITRGADPKKVFPALALALQPVSVQGEDITERGGPIEVITTMTAAEAAADLELLLKAEQAGSLSADDLFPSTTDTTHGKTNGHQPSR
jgi:hypothetical protein